MYKDMADFRLSSGDRGRAVSRGALDVKAWSDAHSVSTGEDSLVQQQFADEVDVNTIVRRFGVTGAMPFGLAGGVYGDFSGVTDYESAREMVDRADRAFMALPPDVRERVGHDPGAMVKLAQEMSEDEFRAYLEPAKPDPVVPPVDPAV